MVNKLRVLDLFSGIGGFSLGLERTGGFETVAFCEIDPFCRKVLAKHWPKVKQYEDVRELTAERLGSDGISVDVICGGFPCQDISTAGHGAGIGGERSGLWKEYARLIGELRPRYVLVENVAALLARGIDVVLGDLATLGFDAEWHCIPASAVGAPHRRDRVWIVANANGIGCERADLLQRGRLGSLWCGQAMAHAASGARHDVWRSRPQSDAGWDGPRNRTWETEPNVGRVADGVPDRFHRLKALGNAVVPQIPELIGRAILNAMEARS
jgi:DNA (cytosine-5)-methyltransferase 1